MKILHTADWHLGKRLDYLSRFEEQKEVLVEICTIANEQEVDLVLVAGDLFDAFNPPVDATELLYQTLKRLTNQGTRPVIAIAGNHDSPDRIDSPESLARACGIIFIGYPHAEIRPFTMDDSYSITQSDKGFIELKINHLDYPIRIITTPYANEVRLKQFLGIEDKAEQLHEVLKNNWELIAEKYCDKNGVNILTAHLYMLERGGEILEEPEGEKPIKIGNADIIYTDAIPPSIQYTALGHLHRFQFVKGHSHPVVYASSPLCYSFSEAGQTKKVVIIEIEPDIVPKINTFSLTKGKSLHRKRFDSIEDAVLWLRENPYTLVELTIATDVFMTSQELKRLHEAHDGIVHIIPIVNRQVIDSDNKKNINLDQDINNLFKDFFISKYGQEPNEDINALFKEIVNSTKDVIE